MVSRLVAVGLILVCALVAPAQAQLPGVPVPNDLSEAILNGPALQGRDVVGQAAALVSAAQGRAFVLEVAQGRPTARALNTYAPVYKAFGLNASGRLLAYRPLAGNAPSGDLVIEDVATHASRRIASRYVVEAAWSPGDPALLAITFAAGEGYGLALLDTRTRSPRVVRSAQVLADYVAWEADGGGVYYYKAVDTQRRGVSSETGLVVVEQAYVVLTPSFHPVRPSRLTVRQSSEAVAPAVLPAGFPVVDHRAGPNLADPVLEQLAASMAVNAQSLQAAELPADLYSFRVTSPAGDYEVQGRNLLSDDELSLRALPDGKPWRIGRGHLVKVTDGGILYRVANVDGSTLEFVTWTGERAFVSSSAAITYGIPFPSGYVTQGGQGYPSPACGTYYYTHRTGTSMAYAYDFVNNPGHILASAPGTVAYVKKDVTCNSCAGASCPDYVSGCSANSGWGNVVILEHADGTWTKYTHIKTNYAWVTLGQSVCAGYYIAFQGHTGCASGGTCGDHLHFQRQTSSALSGTSLPVDFFDAVNPLACYKSYPSGLNEVTTCPTTCVDTAVPATSWKAEYFAGTALEGTPLMVRNEGTGTLGFDWGENGPGCTVPAHGFSARFTRTITFPAATHRFTVTSDDGVRLWVDGTPYLDKWMDQATTYTFDVPLAAGSHTVKVEYYENQGGASLSLSWQALGGVPEFLCDDGDACLAFYGPAAYWHKATTCGASALGYGGDMYWTYVNGSVLSNYVRWTPALGGPGTYQVSVFVPRCNGTSIQAKYAVVHNGVTEYKAVNQNGVYDAWVSLGSFAFAGTGGEYVELADGTGESYATRRLLAVDAAKWVRQ